MDSSHLKQFFYCSFLTQIFLLLIIFFCLIICLLRIIKYHDTFSLDDEATIEGLSPISIKSSSIIKREDLSKLKNNNLNDKQIQNLNSCPSNIILGKFYFEL